MRKTLRNLVLKSTMVLALLGGCKEEEVRRNTNIPEARDNQQIILHPDYMRGHIAFGYILLTDIDRKGGWDLVENTSAGFTTGDYSCTLYCKNGFSPITSATCINAEVEFVEPKFFNVFDGRSRYWSNECPPEPMFIGPSTNTSTGEKTYIHNGKIHRYDSNGKLISVDNIE